MKLFEHVTLTLDDVNEGNKGSIDVGMHTHKIEYLDKFIAWHLASILSDISMI